MSAGLERFRRRMNRVRGPKGERQITVLGMVKKRLSRLERENQLLRENVRELRSRFLSMGLDERVVAAGLRLAFADIKFARTLNEDAEFDYHEEQKIRGDYFAAQDAFREALKEKARKRP